MKLFLKEAIDKLFVAKSGISFMMASETKMSLISYASSLVIDSN